MTLSLRLFVRFVMVLVAGALGVSAAAGQSFSWRTDYNSARKEASDKNKPLLIDFGTENCFWCKKLDSSTFRDSKVVALLAERFVPLKIDAEQSPQLTQTLRIQSFPTLMIASHDGKILTIIEGYVEAPKLIEQLHKALTPSAGAAPDWMARDYQDAGKAIALGDYSRGIALLKVILEENKDLPIQVKAKLALEEVEKQADNRLAHARKMEDQGQVLEAIDTLTELMRRYSGSTAANDAKNLLTSLAARPEIRDRQRSRRAKELLAMAREEFRTQQFSGCLEKCELLAATYSDLTEGTEASQLASEIKNNPEWMAKACNSLNERLSNMYLTLAETWVKKGKQDEAALCYEKVQQLFPGTHYAQMAQVKLAQLQGKPAQLTEFKKQ